MNNRNDNNRRDGSADVPAFQRFENVPPKYAEDMFLAEVYTESRCWVDRSKNSGNVSFRQMVARAFARIQLGHTLGIPPTTALKEISIMVGKLLISGALHAHLVSKSDRYSYKEQVMTNDECILAFYDGGELLGESRFSIACARKAKLGNRNDNWEKFPRSMLFNRAMTEGVRRYCPSITQGTIYTPDEVAEFADPDPEDQEPRVYAASEEGEGGAGEVEPVVVLDLKEVARKILEATTVEESGEATPKDAGMRIREAIANDAGCVIADLTDTQAAGYAATLEAMRIEGTATVWAWVNSLAPRDTPPDSVDAMPPAATVDIVDGGAAQKQEVTPLPLDELKALSKSNPAAARDHAKLFGVKARGWVQVFERYAEMLEEYAGAEVATSQTPQLDAIANAGREAVNATEEGETVDIGATTAALEEQIVRAAKTPPKGATIQDAQRALCKWLMADSGVNSWGDLTAQQAINHTNTLKYLLDKDGLNWDGIMSPVKTEASTPAGAPPQAESLDDCRKALRLAAEEFGEDCGLVLDLCVHKSGAPAFRKMDIGQLGAACAALAKVSEANRAAYVLGAAEVLGAYPSSAWKAANKAFYAVTKETIGQSYTSRIKLYVYDELGVESMTDVRAKDIENIANQVRDWGEGGSDKVTGSLATLLDEITS